MTLPNVVGLGCKILLVMLSLDNDGEKRLVYIENYLKAYSCLDAKEFKVECPERKLKVEEAMEIVTKPLQEFVKTASAREQQELFDAAWEMVTSSSKLNQKEMELIQYLYFFTDAPVMDEKFFL